MPSTWTSTLQLEKQAFGENNNSWGTRDDVNWDKIDRAINGWLIKDLTGVPTPYQLTFIQGQLDEVSFGSVRFVGATAGTFTIVVPAVTKNTTFENGTANNILVQAIGTSANYLLPPGARASIRFDGSAFLDTVNYTSGSLTVAGSLSASSLSASGGALTVAAGGTGAGSVAGAYANLTIPGVIHWYAGSTAPSGWLICNGSAVSRTTFSALFGAIGANYGNGDGATTFNIPDLQGRVLVGAGAGAGLTSRPLASTGGEEAHLMALPEMIQHFHNFSVTTSGTSNDHTHSGTTGNNNADHSHTYTLPNTSTFNIQQGGGAGGIGGGTGGTGGTGGASNPHAHAFSTGGMSQDHTHTVAGSTGGVGGSAAANVMQPYLALTAIIKT